MDESDDPYIILNVPHDATAADIKKSYRKLALRHHPDKQTSADRGVKAHNIFAKISNAYELLSDEEERKMYDWKHGRRPTGTSRPTSSTTFHNNTNFPSTSMPQRQQSRPSTKCNWSGSSSHFHDPFSVFEQVFREEFGDDAGNRSAPKSPKKSGATASQEGALPPGAVEVSMQTAMKTINGKSVTVTERVYTLPDGSQTTRVEKAVDGSRCGGYTSPKATKPKANVSSPAKKSPRTPTNSTSNKPKATTKIVNGMKETTTVYPDGRSQTKSEPVESTSMTTSYSPQKSNSPTKTCGNQAKVTTRIANGKKEITIEYPGGRVQTRTEPLPDNNCRPCSTSSSTNSQRQPKMTSSSPPSGMPTRKKETTICHPGGRIVTKMEQERGLQSPPESKATTMQIPFPKPGVVANQSSSKQQTRIVNGKKETITEHVVTRADGTTASRFEKKIEAIGMRPSPYFLTG